MPPKDLIRVSWGGKTRSEHRTLKTSNTGLPWEGGLAFRSSTAN